MAIDIAVYTVYGSFSPSHSTNARFAFNTETKHAHATMGIKVGCKEDLSGKVAIVTGE